jgi:sugar lactone lactonase YvrE
VANVRSDVVVTPVGDVLAVLGEGPYWVPTESALLWVDIAGGRLHRTEIPSGATTSAEIDMVSAAFPASDGGVLYASGNRVVLRQPAPGPATGLSGGHTDRVVAVAPAHPTVRFNDGAVDPAGRVWIGSMHEGETRPLGTLYRLDPGPVPSSAPGSLSGSRYPAALTAVAPQATVSNGLAWSPDGSRMYYADSPTRRLDVFNYDLATGEATGRRVLADLSGYDGFPDGLTVDGEGYVWVCMWDGAAIRRFSPSGSLDTVVPVPVARPTSVAFGGEDMADLFVTTASIDLTESERAAQPLAGRLLQLRPGPVGLPATTTAAIIPA